MADVPFRLDVIETPDEWVIVCECPQGRTVAHVPLPFSVEELPSRLAAVEMQVVRSTSRLITRKASRAELSFGRELSKILLADDVRILFALCREKAREQRSTMRVLLNPVGPNVCRIPWEFAIDPDAGDDYLALRVPLARSPHLMEPVAPLLIEPPLRVLGVMSRPSDLPQLEADRERREITEALAGLSSELVHIEWMESDRWQELRTKLQSQDWHILHFIGHGGFDEEAQSGYIELTDDDGSALRVQAGDLAGFIQHNPQLKLVVLNACESAATGSDGVFSSTAAKLMRAGVPAVVAMQYEITDPAALAFACSFYEAIARGVPVDRSVTLAREDVKISTGSLEWATPVLFLASEETQIFTMPEAAMPQQQPVQPPPVQRQPVQQQPAQQQPAQQQPAQQQPGATAPPPGRHPGVAPTPVARTTPDTADWSGQVRAKVTALVAKLTPAESQVTRGARSPATTARSAPRERATAEPPVAAARHEPPSGLALTRLWASPPLGRCAHLSMGPQDLAALACADGIRVMSLATGRELARCALPRSERPVQIAWSPWPRHLATLHDGGDVIVWELESETPVHVLAPTAGRATRLAFSHDGRWLAVACDDRSLHVFSAAGVEVRSLGPEQLAAASANWQTPVRSITALAFRPDRSHLLVGGDDGMVRELDVRGDVIQGWRHTHGVSALALSADRIATGSQDGRVRIWGWDGAVISRMDGGPVGHAGFSPTGDLATVADATCRVWDRNAMLVGSATLAARGVGLGFSSSGNLITATDAGQIEAWSPRAATGEGGGT